MNTLQEHIETTLQTIEGYQQLYLDCAASMPLLPQAQQTFCRLSEQLKGNCHSSHQLGQSLQSLVEHSTQVLAQHLNVAPKEIYWTSSATESNNLALNAAYQHLSSEYKKVRFFIHPMAHASVREPALSLGGEILDYDRQNQRLILCEIEKALQDPNTGCLIALAWGCNETGYLEDFSDLGLLLHQQKNVWLHADAAQSLGKVPLNLRKSIVTSMSFSGHKIGAPTAIGALYIKSRPVKNFKALLQGGNQQQGVRSGTLSVPLITSFAVALEENSSASWNNVALLKKELEEFLVQTGFFKIVSLKNSLPSILGVILKNDQQLSQVSFLKEKLQLNSDNIPSTQTLWARKILESLKQYFFFSQSAACSSQLLKTSLALSSLGLSDLEQVHYCRFSFSQGFNREQLELIKQTIENKILKPHLESKL